MRKRFITGLLALAFAGVALPSAPPVRPPPPMGDIVPQQRYPINNRVRAALPGPEISVLVYRPARANTERLAVVMHGRNGRADAPHMKPVIAAYLARGYTVVAPDASFSNYNDSYGDGRGFTIGQHVADLNRTIAWARDNAAMLGWDGRRFALAGHSMGGFAVSYLAATRYAQDVVHVLAVAPFTSGERQMAARGPDGVRRLAMETPQAPQEWLRHDIHRHIDDLDMPVSAIVGGRDTVTPAADVRDYYRALPRPAYFTILPDQHHSLKGDQFFHTVLWQVRGMDRQAGVKRMPVPYS